MLFKCTKNVCYIKTKSILKNISMKREGIMSADYFPEGQVALDEVTAT